ncbi:glycoside hydrolase family 38 N-terminal domain-containing protein [Candidatus Bipolaricaulota sp. J31]
MEERRRWVAGLSAALILLIPALGLSRTDAGRELRAALAEFLARCVLAERAGVDPAEIERIAAPVILPRERRSARETLHVLAAAEEALSEIFPGEEAFIARLRAAAARVPLYLFPQCHIDLVWQWNWDETVEITLATFRRQLELSRSMPGYRFCQGQAALYEAVERADPGLFREIKAAIREGRWRVVGGNWAETVMEQVTGESVIRNFLLGKRYFQERFGLDVDVAWQMEGTGLPAALPQILRGLGFTGAIMGRERPWTGLWRPISRWRGSDGTEIPLVLLDHYVLRPTELLRKAVQAIAASWPRSPPRLAFVFGGGDHGGGPDRGLFGRLTDAARSAGLEVRWDGPAAFFADLDPRGLPVLEGIPKVGGIGVATQPAVKRLIRECEHGLLALEALRAVLALSGVDPEAARGTADSNEMWKILIKCQFHDALWGSTSYAPSREVLDWLAGLRKEIEAGLDRALSGLAARVDTLDEGLAVIVFNPLPVPRSGVVSIPGVTGFPGGELVAVGADGSARPVARTGGELAFVARDVPATGYRVYWLRSGPSPEGARAVETGGRILLEAGEVSATVDARTGRLLSLSIPGGPTIRFPDGGLRLEVWRDAGSAWGPRLTGRLWAETRARPEVRIVASGPAVAAVSARFPIPGGGWVEREIRVWDGLPWVECVLRGEWAHPRAQLLVILDTGAGALRPVTGAPFGAVDWEDEAARRLYRADVVERLRALRRFTGDPARELGYQVPLLRWADIADGERGLAVLVRGLFGVRTRPGAVAIPILRSPPFVEQGDWVIHRQPADVPVYSGLGPFEVGFALLPHPGDWRVGSVPGAGLIFNLPLVALVTGSHPGDLPPEATFLSVEGPALFSCLKPAEDGSGDLILRLYEPYGEQARVTIRFAAPVGDVREADLLERPQGSLGKGEKVELALGPFRILTLRIRR